MSTRLSRPELTLPFSLSAQPTVHDHLSPRAGCGRYLDASLSFTPALPPPLVQPPRWPSPPSALSRPLQASPRWTPHFHTVPSDLSSTGSQGQLVKYLIMSSLPLPPKTLRQLPVASGQSPGPFPPTSAGPDQPHPSARPPSIVTLLLKAPQSILCPFTS